MTNSKKPAIILFIKVPKPGFVKTRLICEFFNERQVNELQIEMIKDTLLVLSSLQTDFQPIISFYPKNELSILKDIIQSFNSLIPDSFIKQIQYIDQEGTSIGSHFASAFLKTFQLKQVSSCIIIGGDTPHITVSLLENALEWLRTSSKNFVIGPSQNSGFYLYGLSEMINNLENIFSKPNEFDNLLTKSNNHELQIRKLPFLFDIDTFDDILKLIKVFPLNKDNKRDKVNLKKELIPYNTIKYLKKVLPNNSYF